MRNTALFFAGFGVLLIAVLVALLLQPAAWASFDAQGAQLLAMIWGKITLLDLYAGFMLALVFIWLFERALWVKLLMTISLPLLGNPVLAIWLVVRFRHLLARSSVQSA